MDIKRKYQGQILAVVLVIMVVGVVIALAMMSRVGSEEILTKEEDLSSDALETADSTLDAVMGLNASDIQEWAEGSPICHGGDPASYDFLRDGCDIIGLNSLWDFLNHFGLVDSYYSTIESTMIEQCGYDSSAANADDAIKIIIGHVAGDQEIEVLKDQVFSIILRSPDAPSCSLDVNSKAGSAGNVGVIYTPIYAQMTDDKISSYREYDTNVIYGQCLTSACHGTSGWRTSGNYVDGVTSSFPIKIGSDSIYELRIRAVGDFITFTRDYVGDCDGVQKDDMLLVSAIINCNGQSRGKQFILTKETWAPAIFDYVLFNGNGSLELQ